MSNVEQCPMLMSCQWHSRLDERNVCTDLDERYENFFYRNLLFIGLL